MTPKKMIIPNETVQEYLGTMFYGLEKDLYSNDEYTEEICSFCKGTGVVKADNSYGLSEERSNGMPRFPYKHQSVTFCPHCFNGIVKRCNKCGDLIPRGYLKHDCAEQKAIDAKEKAAKEMEILESIPEASEEQIASCKMFYSDSYPYNEGYFETFDDFFDAWESEHVKGDEKPTYCYGTDEVSFDLDAENIVSNACDDMYEDAYDDVSNIDELQVLLDNWADKNGPSRSYEYHRRFKVRIPWD